MEASWSKYLGQELHKDYMKDLFIFLDVQKIQGKMIYPPQNEIFEAFNLTPFNKVKVVILGQDPYHGPDQAHGLAFSVRKDVRVPPSLQNIFKELESDLNIPRSTHGHLKKWAQEGVLLLNNVLTVENAAAGSHHGKGWEIFTSKVIEVLNKEKESLVFILWGAPAQKKAREVDPQKHLIIQGVHPSPLSSYRGFFGSKPFSQTNAYLKSKGLKEIDWSLT